MLLQQFNKTLQIDENAFAWRYMNFFKIWDILYNRKIYFARLDQFDDPIEGLPLEYRRLLQTRRILNFNSPKKDRFDLNLINTLPTKMDLDKWQKWNYCSCWYLTEKEKFEKERDPHHESFAMWKFMNCKDGFLLKIKFEKLLLLFSEAINLIDEYSYHSPTYGKVQYLNYGEYERLLENNLLMPSLIKHNSYKFENELRFMILKNSFHKDVKLEGLSVELKSNLDVKEFQIDVIAHPNMDEKSFRKYQRRFRKIGIELMVSTIMTRDRANEFLKL